MAKNKHSGKIVQNSRLLVGLVLLVLSIPYSAEARQKPNILWINCDDLGKELSSYGNQQVHTPVIDRLAREGQVFTNAYANAPVCSSSRSSQILGLYPTRLPILNHRNMSPVALPDSVPTIMQLFREAGYFCSNGAAGDLAKPGKEDYNFVAEDLFDGTDWRQRQEGQPFFAQVQIHEPHRTFVHDELHPIDPAEISLPALYPDHPLIRADWARYLESVQRADRWVGEILDRLEEDGELESTIVILYGDHGRPHLRDKQWLYEGGLAVPLIIRYPNSLNAGKVDHRLISLVDISASTLGLAGLPIPTDWDGKDIIGGAKNSYIYGFRQRCGDAVDDIRSISDGEYKLIWNRMPEQPYMQLSSYKKLQYPAYTLYRDLDQKGELSAPFSAFMATTKPDYELYHLKVDPYEIENLADNPAYQGELLRLKEQLERQLQAVETYPQEESEALIQQAKSSSRKYYQEAMQRRNLGPDPTDAEILDYWNHELLLN